MENAQPGMNTEPSAPNSAQFTGPATARQLRVIEALLRGPLTREEVDKVAGASNGPHVIMELRNRGLSIPCSRRLVLDRDGHVCRPGRYSLTSEDLRMVELWLAQHD